MIQDRPNSELATKIKEMGHSGEISFQFMFQTKYYLWTFSSKIQPNSIHFKTKLNHKLILSRTMTSNPKDILRNTLDNLSGKDFKRFKFRLTDQGRIPWRRLERADTDDTVKEMARVYDRCWQYHGGNFEGDGPQSDGQVLGEGTYT